jgi:predicted ATPase
LVGRDTELTQLQALCDTALTGRRQLVFVTGEAGVGKTALVEHFLARPQTAEPGRIAWGQCIEHYGAGEAYLPVLEALGSLGRGPGHEELVAILRRVAPSWLVQLPALVEEAELEALQRKVQGVPRERMLREFADALAALTAEEPLVVVLEDLHWSDVSTVELLAFLARRRESGRWLLIGTYRPVDAITQGHPLPGLMRELHAHGQCVELRLELLTLGDVRAYLCQRLQAEALPPGLSEVVYGRTEGNALFMVTFVASLLERGLLVRVNEQWELPQGLAVIEANLPQTLRELLQQQVKTLGTEEQRMLEVASVAGVHFTTAAVAAGVNGEPQAVEALCEGIAQRGQVIQGRPAEEWPDGTFTASYEFRHALYQQVLYTRQGEAQRARLHRVVGVRVEAGYGEETQLIAAELAVHFEQAREYRKAVQYHGQAGENALRRNAYQEALLHLTRGLELSHTLPDTLERKHQELALRASLNAVLVAIRGYTAEELGQNLRRARELCQEMNELMKLAPILVGLTRLHMMRADRTATEELMEEEYRLIERLHDPACLVQLHTQLGTAELARGRHARAREHHAQALKLYNPMEHATLGFSFGFDPVALALVMSGVRLWLSGWPEQAWQEAERAIARAKELAQPFFLVNVLAYAAWVRQFRGELDQAWALTQTSVRLEHEQGFAPSVTRGTLEQGCVLGQRGEIAEGLKLLTEGLAQYRATGTRIVLPRYLSVLAELYGQQGKVEEGLGVIAEAIQLTETHFDRFWAAEVYRLKGELTLQQSKTSLGPVAGKSRTSQKGKSRGPKKWSVVSSQLSVPSAQEEAEACFHKAIEIAKQQEAKSLELRAAMSLSRLWQQQGKRKEARTLLKDIYGWFTEGFDTKDLQEAKALLDALRA